MYWKRLQHTLFHFFGQTEESTWLKNTFTAFFHDHISFDRLPQVYFFTKLHAYCKLSTFLLLSKK